jgi:hypothetical protein
MKKKLLPFVFMLVSTFALGQNYTIDPSDTLAVLAPHNEFTGFYIYQTNNSNSTIFLKWKLISNKLLAGWDFSLCDFSTCHEGIPDSSMMTPIEPGGQGFLAVNVFPYEIPGTGTVRMYVYEDGKPLDGDTLTWLVTSVVPSGINEYALTNVLTVYPNPANEIIYVKIQDTKFSNASIRVMNLLGETLMNVTSGKNDLNMIPVSGLANGAYFVQYKDPEGLTTTKKIYIAR